MKLAIITSLCSLVLALNLFGQSPAVSAVATATASPAAVSPAAPAASSPSEETDLERRIEKKLKRHFNISFDDDDGDTVRSGESDDDIPALAIPLVGIIFMSIFGAPVLIVAVIMYFGFSKNRMMHKTVRMMVEKGQEVPPALLAPPAPAQRKRSDMRRGIVLLMVGLGIMLFLGAVNDWSGGAWSIGLIPLLIGVGYLLVWKLEGGKENGDKITPPV